MSNVTGRPGVALMLTRPNWALVFLVVGASQFFLRREFDSEMLSALLFSIPLAALALGNESRKSVLEYGFMLLLVGMMFALPFIMVMAFFDTQQAMLTAGGVTFATLAAGMLTYAYKAGVEAAPSPAHPATAD